MGVPAFFRWLSRKYASIVVHCVEEKAKEVDGVKSPVDASQPNPNDYEFDNLYLDMNGIIHPCCHPENKPAPKNEDEMMVAIFEYIDRIFSIVRPRKLLYMAIDGVAPRAKMNQQRSRRFRASKETREKAEEISKIRSDLTAKGARLPPEKEKTEHFDSNCITPGTEFMDNLSISLRYYIADRLNTDPGWRNIKVILSDANVPGEGEHKIMDYIRKQRASPGHDPNTRHCLNGADADLIMLGLATHEPHFTIIREEFKPGQKRPCDICGQVGHMMDECTGLPKQKEGEFDELTKPVSQEVEFIFIRLNVLREYLERELEMQSLPFPYSFERCLDDWVFMCFFVGNDFLPHLPSLEIREGAIDRLVKFYKNVVPRCGGYITENGYVDLNKVQLVLSELGYVEDEIFKKRQQDNIAYKKRLKANKERERIQKMRDSPMWVPGGQFSPHLLGAGIPGAVTSPRQQAADMRRQGMAGGQARDNHSAAADLRAMLTKPDDPKQGSSAGAITPEQGIKRKADDDDDDPPDNIRLWEDGWKGRYYSNKFGVSESDEGFDDFRKNVADAYVEGLCWVLRYYYQGCPSWKWYYPYHYAPFASDFRDLGQLKDEFERGTKPFKPLEQLMGVFPAASGKFLPPTWRELMSHPESPIIDFYPVDFEIDLNGKKFAWQGVALLPFVDEKRLLNALAKVYPDISEDERKRNSLGKDRLFAREGHPAFDFFKGLYEGPTEPVDLVTDLTQGMSGKVEPEKDAHAILPHKIIPSPVTNLRDLRDNRAIGVLYEDPHFSDDYVYKTTVLPNAEFPPRVLKPGDQGRDKPWRPVIGMNHDRRSYASIAPAGHRMVGFHTSDRQQGPPSLMGMPPSQFGRGGYGGGSYEPRQNSYRSGGGHNHDNRRASYGNDYYGNRGGFGGAGGYGNSNYRNSNYGGGGYGNTGSHQQAPNQYSAQGYRGNQSRDPRGNQQRDDRRNSYPLSNYRYRPY